MVEALQAIIDWKSQFRKGWVTLAQNFMYKRTSPTNYLCMIR